MAEETSPTLPLPTRLWFAWVCFFRVLFDARFGARAWAAGTLGATPPKELPASAASHPPAPRAQVDSPRVSNELAATVGPQPVRALQLLSLLQREGRFVDFLQQDIATFADAEVGAAARVVHEGCRKALRTHATIEPVRTEAEGANVILAEGFAADEVKLTGGVGGQPPYRGTLRHRGWRTTRFALPELTGGHDVRILAPAEVELP